MRYWNSTSWHFVMMMAACGCAGAMLSAGVALVAWPFTPLAPLCFFIIAIVAAAMRHALSRPPAGGNAEPHYTIDHERYNKKMAEGIAIVFKFRQRAGGPIKESAGGSTRGRAIEMGQTICSIASTSTQNAVVVFWDAGEIYIEGAMGAIEKISP